MYLFVKRTFDFVFAILSVAILLPFMIPIILGLMMTGERHVFYKQLRVGMNNKLFPIFKFATMLKDSPNMKGGLITLKNDPRLTPLGGFLRKTKINELPQFLNVLNGSMSFVGPRPVMKKSFEQYPLEIQNVIYNVKPGITGIGSIIFRDEESLVTQEKNKGNDPWEFYKNKIYPYKGLLEIWYQEKKSFTVDLLLLLLTFWVILFPITEIVYSIFPSLPKRPF